MKAFILDGSSSDSECASRIAVACSQQLAGIGWEVETFPLRAKSLRPCLSCSACGYKTPGQCAQKDCGNEIVKATAQCQEWVLVTPIVFGGYAPLLKKALERTLPNIHPYFMMYRGEFHHRLRYDRRPAMTFIGWQQAEEGESRDIFTRLCARSAANFQVPHRTTVISGAPTPDALDQCLSVFLAQPGVR